MSECFPDAARWQADESAVERPRVVLNDEEAARFLDALDHCERFQSGLAWLTDRPAALPS